MTLLSSIWRRQLVSNSPRKAIPVDFAIESFQCVKDDEYLVLGRDSTIEVPPFACRFNKTALGGYLLAIADEDGCVKLLDTRKNGQKSLLKEWSAHTNAIFDVAWMEGEEKLVTASGDQTAVLWDACVGKPQAVFRGHNCSLKSVNFRDGDPFVFSTGARDGNIMIWDVRCNRRSGNMYQPVNTIHNAHRHVGATPQRQKRRARRSAGVQPVTVAPQSVTAVLFQGHNMLISAGAVDGNIKIWDLRKSYTTLKQDPVAYHIFPYPGNGTRKHGFSSLIFDSTQSQLFASCTNDKIYMYNCSSLGKKPICTYSGHLNSTFYVKAALSPDDTYLLSGSSNNDAYVWKVNDPESMPFVLKGHVGEVTSVAWCSSDQGQLVTCSDDNNFRIWRMDRHNHASDKTERVGHCERVTSVVVPNSPADADSSSPPRAHCISPATSPSTWRTWTPTTKVYTNPRLNPLSSPVAMVTENTLNSPKSLCNDSPNAPKSPSNQLRDVQQAATKGFFQNGFPRSPPSPRQPSSPQALLKSWLKLTPRKDKDGKYQKTVKASPTARIRQQLENRPLRPTMFNMEHHKNATSKGKNSKLLLENRFEDKTKLDSQSKGITSIGQDAEEESPTKSPAAKRRCILGPSNIMVSCSKADNISENSGCPTKQGEKDKFTNCNSNQGSVLSKQMKNLNAERNSKTAHKTSETKASLPNDRVLEKSKDNENWLELWSKHLKARHGSSCVEKDCTHANQHPPDCMSQDEEQPDSIASLPQTSPRTTILTYFKPSS